MKKTNAPRKRTVGDVICTHTAVSNTGEIYWFEGPRDHVLEDGLPPGAVLHGPFKTEAEADEDQRIVLLGPQCEVTEGGRWDPAWDKPQ